MDLEESQGPEDAADVAESRRERREQEEREELLRRSTVIKVRAVIAIAVAVVISMVAVTALTDITLLTVGDITVIVCPHCRDSHTLTIRPTPPCLSPREVSLAPQGCQLRPPSPCPSRAWTLRTP